MAESKAMGEMLLTARFDLAFYCQSQDSLIKFPILPPAHLILFSNFPFLLLLKNFLSSRHLIKAPLFCLLELRICQHFHYTPLSADTLFLIGTCCEWGKTKKLYLMLGTGQVFHLNSVFPGLVCF